MDMLQAMSDKGVPVPLRVMAAAGGLNLDRLLAGQDSDLLAQESLYQYQKKIKDLKKKYGIDDAGDMGGGGMGGGFASTASSYDQQLMHMARTNPGLFEAFRAQAQSIYNQNLDNTHSDVLARNNGQIVGLANREFGEMGDAYGYSHDGKKKHLTNQKLAKERQNEKIVKFLRDRDARTGVGAKRSRTRL